MLVFYIVFMLLVFYVDVAVLDYTSRRGEERWEDPFNFQKNPHDDALLWYRKHVINNNPATKRMIKKLQPYNRAALQAEEQHRTQRIHDHVLTSPDGYTREEKPVYKGMHWGDKGTVSAWFVNPEATLIERRKE